MAGVTVLSIPELRRKAPRRRVATQHERWRMRVTSDCQLRELNMIRQLNRVDRWRI
jgi:hypothetical protein